MEQYDDALPGYQVHAQLYQSDRTVVYRAVRAYDRRPVILKILRPTSREPLAVERYRHEYEVTRALNRAGAAQIYGAVTHGDVLALVVEDFGGTALHDLMQAWRQAEATPPALPELLELAHTIAQALAEVHAAGVVHKDLNPGNIVLNPATGEVKLIDFELAATLSRGGAEPQRVLEGTLAYIAPEQTGRLNRPADHRADLYALGVTLYELLTGRLPFAGADPLELVHAHLARMPRPPHEIAPYLPPQFSAIIMKLLAKNPEDRYQSTAGLVADLAFCAQHLSSPERLAAFTPGQHDRAAQLQLPRLLYGRVAALEQLGAAFARAAAGGRELVLVTGASGIGKTALVSELHGPVAERGGYFVGGKFEQYQSLPYLAWEQAFVALVHRLLSETDARLEALRAAIQAAVGANGRLLTDLIPYLELIIGPQPDVPPLEGRDAQHRLEFTFRSFIGALARAEHPLVVVLDDLQWADGASLNLLQLILDDQAPGHLLVIGAHRDTEMPPAHPLRQTLAALAQATPVTTVALAPLGIADLSQLIADTLGYAPEQARPLSELVHQRTAGNPFYVTQFLFALHDGGLLTWHGASRQWQCDLAQIRAFALSADAPTVLAQQLQKLPPATQRLMALAACLGNQFDLATLALVAAQTPAHALADLRPALHDGLLVATGELHLAAAAPAGDAEEQPSPAARGHGEQAPRADGERQKQGFRFLHDQVQQAVYNLLSKEEQQAQHLHIGQALWQHTPEAERPAKLFTIVHQLNRGRHLLGAPAERVELAQLNLQAGERARATTAYGAATDYLTAGLELLPEHGWERHYELTLALHLHLAEAAYLIGDFEQMEQLTAAVLARAATLLDKVKAHEIRIQAAIARNQPREALRQGLDVLRELGTPFPEQVGPEEIGAAFQEAQEALAGRQAAELLGLPLMTSPVSLAAMRIMLSIGAPIFLVAPALFPILIVRQLILSIRDGNTGGSTYAYVSYGMLRCSLGDVEGGHSFGQLALELLQHLGVKEQQAGTSFMYCVFIHHRQGAIAETLGPLLDGYQAGMATGDLEFAGYCAAHRVANAYHCGRELGALATEAAELYAAIHTDHQAIAYNYAGTTLQAVRNLRGASGEPWALTGDACDEARLIPLYQQTGEISGLHHLILNKLILAYLFGAYPQALDLAAQSEQYLAGVPGTVAVALHHMYAALSALALYEQGDAEARAATLARVAQGQEQLEHWAAAAPMNYRHKWALVEAELCRARGDAAGAIGRYDEAIAGARAGGFLQDEALAGELAARFYLGWGKPRVAQAYMQEAHEGYQRWGATAKAAQIEQRYPELLRQARRPQAQQARRARERETSGGTSSIAIDVDTVIKASRAIAGEIDLARLLASLMRIVIENGGAQRGALILERDGVWVIEARGEGNHEIAVLQALDLRTSAAVSVEIVSFVTRTRESVVLDDAAGAGSFTHDPYLTRNGVRSVLCIPLLDQGRLGGILYLENNLVAGAFTKERLALLELLSAQMVLALDNARLYQQAQQEVAERQRVEERIRASLREKEILLKEIHHRVKNNLQIIASLLYLQAQKIDAPQSAELLHESQNRINSMAFVHEMLYQSNDYTRVDFGLYLRSLANSLFVSYGVEQRQIALSIAADDVTMSVNLAIPCGLIVNELISNALKHAFPEGRRGTIQIGAERRPDGMYSLAVDDDGVGMAQAQAKTATLGLRLIERLVKQLGGTLEVRAEHGTAYRITFPDDA